MIFITMPRGTGCTITTRILYVIKIILVIDTQFLKIFLRTSCCPWTSCRRQSPRYAVHAITTF